MAGSLLGPAEHLVADRERRDAVAERLDDARQVGSLAGRERRGPAIMEMALADPIESHCPHARPVRVDRRWTTDPLQHTAVRAFEPSATTRAPPRRGSRSDPSC